MIAHTDFVRLSVTVGIEPTPAISDYDEPTGFIADSIIWYVSLAGGKRCNLDAVLSGPVPYAGHASRTTMQTSWPIGSSLPDLPDDATLPVELTHFLRAIGAIT